VKQERRFKDLAVRGVGWLVVKRIFTQILFTGANIILVRLLFPEDFGTFAIIQILVTLSWVFADLGLGRALVQRPQEPGRKLLRSVWWSQVVLALLVVVILWVAGPVLISYYSGQLEARAVWWLRLLAISQVFVNMSLVSATLLERRLAYGRILVGEISGLFVTQVSTILLALGGFGVASFIFGSFIGRLTTLVVLFSLSPWPWGFGWEWRRLKPLLSFGVPYQMAGWIGILNGAVVPIFVGRFPGPGGWSGPEAVGFVSWAGGVAAIPTALAGIVEQILFPFMSRIQGNLELAARVFVRALRVVAITTFGGSALLLVLAPDVTKIIYTPDWLPALPALRLAIFQTAIIALSIIALSALLAFGEAKFYRNMHALWAGLQWVLTVPLVLSLGFWGVNLAGVLVSVTGLYAFVRLRRHLKVNYILPIKTPVLVAALTAVFVFVLAQIFPIKTFVHLALIATIGGGFYLSLIYLFMKKDLSQDFNVIWDLVRGLLKYRVKK